MRSYDKKGHFGPGGIKCGCCRDTYKKQAQRNASRSNRRAAKLVLRAELQDLGE